MPDSPRSHHGSIRAQELLVCQSDSPSEAAGPFLLDTLSVPFASLTQQPETIRSFEVDLDSLPASMHTCSLFFTCMRTHAHTNVNEIRGKVRPFFSVSNSLHLWLSVSCFKRPLEGQRLFFLCFQLSCRLFSTSSHSVKKSLS